MCRRGIKEAPGNPPDAVQVKSDSTSLSRGSSAWVPGLGTRPFRTPHGTSRPGVHDAVPISFQCETCRPRFDSRNCPIFVGIVVVGVLNLNSDVDRVKMWKEKVPIECHLDVASPVHSPQNLVWGEGECPRLRRLQTWTTSHDSDDAGQTRDCIHSYSQRYSEEQKDGLFIPKQLVQTA